MRIVSGNVGQSSAVLLAPNIAENPSVLNILSPLTHHEQRKALFIFALETDKTSVEYTEAENKVEINTIEENAKC
jgi:hypothetical protein